jgi:hypothetical protein
MLKNRSHLLFRYRYECQKEKNSAEEMGKKKLLKGKGHLIFMEKSLKGFSEVALFAP